MVNKNETRITFTKVVPVSKLLGFGNAIGHWKVRVKN